MNDTIMLVLAAVLGSTGLWATVLGVFQAIWKRRNEVRDRVRNENAQKIADLYEKFGTLVTENATQTAGLRELLHVFLYAECSRIVNDYNDGKITHITTEKMHEIQAMYDVYVALGGNGTGKTLYESVKTIPMKQGQ